LKPFATYTLLKDVNNGNFVLMKSHDPILVHVWMGRTQIDVAKDDQNEFLKMLMIQWWVPMKKRSNLYE